MIISLLQTKGGTGKTTLAKCLAYSKTLRKRFTSIALVELDAQGTINTWHTNRPEELKKKDKVSCVFLLESQEKKLAKNLESLNNKYDLLILDVPGESTGKFATRLGASLSDIILIPMRSSTNDESSFADHILPIIQKIIEVDPDRKGRFYIIPTFVHPRSVPKNISAYFIEIMPDVVKCLNSVLPLRSVYENFSRDGATLYDYALEVKSNARNYDQAQKAIDDIEKIAKKILTLKW